MDDAQLSSNAMDSNGSPTGESLKPADARWQERAREWRARLAILVAGFAVFSALSGLSIWLLPFSVPNQWAVIVHTLVGLAFLVPCAWYLVRHWLRYWRDPMSHVQVLGYFAAAVFILCLLSGVVLTWQSVLGSRISYAWDWVHIVTTFATLAFGLPHAMSVPFAAPPGARTLHVQARLRYRKIDQFLLNFMFGEEKKLTSPITDLATEERVIEIVTAQRRLGG